MRHNPVVNAENNTEKTGLFFAFVKYFATELTFRYSGFVHGASTRNEGIAVHNSVVKETRVGTQKPHNAAAYLIQLQPSVSLPSIQELLRQPSLVAAIELLAEAVWNIQTLLHFGGSDVEVSHVGRCPLCYAASIDHVQGTHAMWSLLEFYATYRIARELSSECNGKKTANSNGIHSTNEIHDDAIVADVDTRRLLWTHAIAVCRNAIWNGAVQTLRLSVEQWLYAGTHPTLFAVTTPSQGSASAVQVGGDIFGLRAFLQIQCCLLVQEEVAFEMDTAYTTNKTTPVNKKQMGNMRRALEEAPCKDADDDGVFSELSSLTLQHRGDTELHDSLLALYEMSHGTGITAAFVALTMTAPYDATGGLTLLHWVCARGYEFCVRLLLTAWVAVHRDARLPSNVACTETYEEKRVRIGFARTQGSDLLTDEKVVPRRIAKAIRCTALQFDEGILPCAIRGGNISILRQLFLCGVSRHQWDGGETKSEEMSALLRDPGFVLDKADGSLQERVRDALCATAAADALANAAWKLWKEKVRKLTAGEIGEASYRRSHDGVMRTALAALEFDPHNPLARTTLRDLLARKVIDARTVESLTGEAALQKKRYFQTARRMCEHLFTTDTELERELRSLLQSVPIVSGPSSSSLSSPSLTRTATVPVEFANTFLFRNNFEGGDVSGGGGSSATIAIDENQRPVYALVNLTDPAASATSKTTAMMHPLWVRLPRGVDVQRSLEIAGGLYGVVESALPLVAPVERGDLVIFELRQEFFRFDVTRIVRPQDGVVVEVPCVLEGDGEEVKTAVLRCALVPPPVHELDDDRVKGDPLQWLETTSTQAGDAVEQILNSRQHLQRWLHIAHRCHRTLWFREVSVTPSAASVWHLCKVSNGVHARPAFAVAAFYFASGVGSEEADDPFGITSETIFLLRPQEKSAVKSNVTFRVAGVFPIWGWS
ncbi:hypothetical protein MOQ_005540 [Trypanosoma cruzi marinkellei]|uniref:Uncharacterized protein n=1 Tax=Trypanosoma cruzi marinkellei TaxID=85056 RepID=K2NP70_TRYCR|nr:hypothetical protein MOQ_005540 [Trypanosoma cruzi marinkellei]